MSLIIWLVPGRKKKKKINKKNKKKKKKKKKEKREKKKKKKTFQNFVDPQISQITLNRVVFQITIPPMQL